MAGPPRAEDKYPGLLLQGSAGLRVPSTHLPGEMGDDPPAASRGSDRGQVCMGGVGRVAEPLLDFILA